MVSTASFRELITDWKLSHIQTVVFKLKTKRNNHYTQYLSIMCSLCVCVGGGWREYITCRFGLAFAGITVGISCGLCRAGFQTKWVNLRDGSDSLGSETYFKNVQTPCLIVFQLNLCTHYKGNFCLLAKYCIRGQQLSAEDVMETTPRVFYVYTYYM